LLHSSDSGELIGKLAWELMPTEEQEMSCAAFMAAMESGQDPPVARRSIYTSSGNFRMLELHRNLIRDTEGKPVGMRVVTVDVTEAHKAQEESQRARLWLESVLASLTDAIIVTDALGFIRTVNPAAEELVGWKAAELKGKVIEKALPLLSYCSDNKTQVSFTIALDKRATGVATMLGRERCEMRVEIRSSPIVDKDHGITTGVVSVLRKVEDDSQACSIAASIEPDKAGK
jgi:PAS domain S-box-containing protein